MDEQVPEDVKRERIERLVERVQRHAEAPQRGARRHACRRCSSRARRAPTPEPAARPSRGEQDRAFARRRARGRRSCRCGSSRPRRRPCAAPRRSPSPPSRRDAPGRCDLRRHRVRQDAPRRCELAERRGRRDRLGRRDAAVRGPADAHRTSRPRPSRGARAAPPGRHLAADGRRRRGALRGGRARGHRRRRWRAAASPIVAGGTGLYLRAALADLALPPQPPAGLRDALGADYDADPAGRLRTPRGGRPGRRRAHPPQRPPPRGARARAGRAGRVAASRRRRPAVGDAPTATRPASSACRSSGPSCTGASTGAPRRCSRPAWSRRCARRLRRASRRRPPRGRSAWTRSAPSSPVTAAATRPAGAWSSAPASTRGGRRSGCGASPASSCSTPAAVGHLG